MTAQVIYIATDYFPDEKELKRLDFYQEQMELYHAELAFQSREWSRFQQVVFKEQSHNNVRKSWRLIKEEA